MKTSTIPIIIIFWVLFFDGCSSRQASTIKEEAFLKQLAIKSVSKEIMRIKSSDCKVDAVVITQDVGATSAEATFIYLVPHGGNITKNDDSAIFIGDHLRSINISWTEMRFLEIHYDEARIFKFRNYWENQNVDDYHYHIEIKLVPGQDHSLPLNLRTW
jgi:hypothetical protein